MSTIKKARPAAGTGRRFLSRKGALKVAKWGNCMAVRIPKEKARETGLELGAEVSVEKVKDGVLIRPLRRRPTLRDLVSRITPQNRHGEVDVGPPVGKEIL